MIIRSLLAQQLGSPSGIVGRLVMKLLNLGNVEMNDLTFAQLDLQPGDSVLEIGFGGGYLLNKMAISQIPGLIAGVDPQKDVIQMGYQKFKPQIKQGFIELKQGRGENLPYGNNTFKRVCTVNTIYFWSDPQLTLNECCRVLQPQGKLVICYNSPAFLQQTKLTEHNFQTYEPIELELLMQSCGFRNINTVSANDGKRNGEFYCTSGQC